MFGSDIGTASVGMVGITPVCVSASLAVALSIIVLRCAAGTPGAGWTRCTPSAATCSLDTLHFFYDGDGALQCECLDDEDESGGDWLIG